MAHGLLLGNLASWYFTAAPEIARRHRVLLYDLRGHGRSERPSTGYDVATMAADLIGLMDAFDDQPCALVGHSYGALIALRVALDRPDRVRRLALVEAPLPPSSFRELDGFLEQTPAQMVEALPHELAAALAKGKRQARRFVESVSFLANHTSLIADLRAEPDVPDAELARMRVPTLAVYGTRSSVRPVGERLSRVLPDVRHLELPGGHFLHLDAAPALARALSEFLDG